MIYSRRPTSSSRASRRPTNWRKAGGAQVRSYDLGHFGIYLGAGFDQIVNDEVAFLTRHLVQAEVPAVA